MTLPASTLRVQLHRGFTFDDALAQADYFAALGVSHLYTSPITTARPGSMHGYDTVDYGAVNAELGGEAALRRLAGALRERGIGLVVDIVPNHMGVGGAHNAWWLDVLEWGRRSAHAQYFDIDWQAPDPALRGKVLMPYLGGQYGDEMAAGRIALRYSEHDGRFVATYGEHVCPICPADYAALLHAAHDSTLDALAVPFDGLTTQPDGQRRAERAREGLREFAGRRGTHAFDAALDAHSPAAAPTRDRLHRLLERQHYRLAWWRTAADEVNWRRFFDVTALAALRVERPDVFEAVHGLIFRLYAERVIDGVRVDHIDGLADPRDYCERLRQRLAALRDDEAPFIVVEKILARGETLRADWPVAGTTGYDFMNDVGALLHDAAGAQPLAATWAALGASSAAFADVALDARREILAGHLAAELDRATRALHRIARDDPSTRDYTYASIHNALAQLAICFPVYRIYPADGMRTGPDDRDFDVALDAARRALPRTGHAVLAKIAEWLGGDDDAATAGAEPSARAARRAALALFAQLTAPLAAKAVEDTAFYRYGRLLSRNEVGADPDDFSRTVDAFHADNAARQRRCPHALLATATHDHKRGEDVRARLAVLSEIAPDWSTTLRRWSTLNQPHRRDANGGLHGWTPGPTVEAMLYQTLVGCWPPGLDAADEAAVHALATRVDQWQSKALREAKLRTNWYLPDEAFEAGCRAFLFDILAPQRRDGFLHELAAFVARIAPAGALNSLLQTTLRLTSPGIPDLYQGTELWDFSLVDPDNRRPVDYAARAAALGAEPPSARVSTWHDARVKLGIVQRLLALRAREPALLRDGAYVPLAVHGEQASHVIAFARRHGDALAIVVGARLAMPLLAPDATAPVIAPERWGDTAIALPDDSAGVSLRDWLSDASHGLRDTRVLAVRDVLAALPVAVLVDA